MNHSTSQKSVVSDAERNLLRRSVRDFLARNWPADKAVENSDDTGAIAQLWHAMVRQGLASLGTNPAEGGLREIVLVFEETGRAACPAPLLGAVAANLALAREHSNAARALLDDVHQGNAVVALWLPASAQQLADVAAIARLCCAGRALGSAQRAFDLAVDHAKVRKQFGQLIGQFQAVQHKLANCLIGLDGARLALDCAGETRDNGNPDWRIFAASALAFAGPALRAVSIETQRALGAIGYAEEHEAPRHFRRVHADLARFGGVGRARAELADFLLGPAH